MRAKERRACASCSTCTTRRVRLRTVPLRTTKPRFSSRIADDEGGRRIVAFYEGTGRDDRGRSLDDVLRFDDASLEYTHDYIQWLFPLRERSGANPTAPRLDDATVAAFRARPELRAALRRSYDRMLAFYSADLGWLTPGNHNHLRLTRMMLSLRALGLESEAQQLYAYVTGLAAQRGGVSRDTLRYWHDAIS